MGYGALYFRHTATTTAITIVNGALFYFLRIVLYRYLPSEEDYGLFYAVISFCFLLYPLLSVGFNPGIVPFVTRLRERGNAAAVKRVALGAVLVQLIPASVLLLLTAVFARPIATLCFHAPDGAPLVRALALFIIVLLPFRTGAVTLLGLQYIAARNLAELAHVASCLGVTILLLGRGLGVLAPAYGYVLGAVVGIAVQITALGCLNRAVFRARFEWDPPLVFGVFAEGKYMSVAFGGITLFSYMDTVMLNLIRGDHLLVAAYQIAAPTVMILYAFVMAGTINFMPIATTMWLRGERDLLADGIQRIYEAALAVVLPATVLLACFSDVLLEVLWRNVHDAPDAFNILAVGCVFYMMCVLNVQILPGIGRPRVACTIVLTALGANLVLNLVLIHFFAIRGAAAATVLSHVIAAALGVRAIRRELKIQLRVAAIVASLFLNVIIVLLALGVRATVLYADHRFIVAVLSCALLYVLAIACLELLGVARLRELWRVIRLGRNTPSPGQITGNRGEATQQ
ncbi:MAG TPA: hypothetical protein HPP83_13255 [Candidatus Hydrogenedentes bacterium]|nr:hypothetical protein [Candidatus Hydrogenedentota bacterium]